MRNFGLSGTHHGRYEAIFISEECEIRERPRSSHASQTTVRSVKFARATARSRGIFAVRQNIPTCNARNLLAKFCFILVQSLQLMQTGGGQVVLCTLRKKPSCI